MKKLLVGVLVLTLALGMTACGGGITDSVEKMLNSQGRSYDDLITGEVGETLTCSFFDFTITDVKAVEELEGYTPNTEGNKFIVAEVTVKNIISESIPVGNYDFTILWDSEEEIAEEDNMAYAEFMDGMYPDNVSLAPGESLSGTLVFDIPADVNDFGIVYEEIYEDEFVGDSYVVECTL